MSDTPLLTLPYLAASQAQKHVTHNEALTLLDGLVQLSVISRAVSTPPLTPTDGDRYLIASSPASVWLGHAGQIALRMEGAWRFFTPRKGWTLWVEAENILLVFDGAAWVAPPAPITLQNLSLLGVNATADSTNKLAVSSSSVLFNNAGNGVQFKVNKNVVTDTASLLLQTGFSGRAEIGTTGDDNLHFKVSSNGASFNESLIISGTSGLVTIKNNATLDPQASDPATPSNGQIWYNSTSGKFRGFQNGASVDLISAGGTSTMASFTIKGNNTGAAASPIDLSIAQVKAMLAYALTDFTGTLSAAQEPAHTGDVTNVAGSLALTIAPNIVTNTKLAAMSALTFKANPTLNAANPIDATADQMLVALNAHAHIHARNFIFA